MCIAFDLGSGGPANGTINARDGMGEKTRRPHDASLHPRKFQGVGWFSGLFDLLSEHLDRTTLFFGLDAFAFLV